MAMLLGQKNVMIIYKYKRYFDEANRFLNEGHLKAKNIVGDSSSIELGDIFVIDGMMSLIAEVNQESTEYDKTSGKIRYRVKQIFANGTEPKPFSTSIKSSFYKSEPPCKRIVYVDHIGVEFLKDIHYQLFKTGEGSTMQL